MGMGVGGGGAKSYDGENAWSSINHSILSGYCYPLYSYMALMFYFPKTKFNTCCCKLFSIGVSKTEAY
jgi:hypothetical protein